MLLDELKNDTTPNALDYIFFSRVSKVWKLTSSLVI
jgi:hypothetical protein